MVTKEQLLNSPMGKALLELSTQVEDKLKEPITFNVIGGFALMLWNIRDINDTTDIDYIGDPLSLKFKELSDAIGIKHNFVPGWINNDVMLSGISVEDFEYSTGPLHFEEVFSIGKIKINVLNKEDLLRMKLIAIDTNLTAIAQGGDFTRKKDFKDILLLLEDLHLPTADIRDVYGDYLLNPNTISVIKAYQRGGNSAVRDKIDDILHGRTHTLKPVIEDAKPSYSQSIFVSASRYKSNTPAQNTSLDVDLE